MIDPRYSRRVNILSDYSNDLLDLIIEYTAFAAQQGVYDAEHGPVHFPKPWKKKGKKKKPEFSSPYTPYPGPSPYEATEAQAEAWMTKKMGEEG